MAKRQDEIAVELKAFIAAVRQHYSVYAVVLFGSYAEGKPHEFSDIDVAVFSDDFGKNPLEEMKSLFHLRRKIDTDIEPLPFSKQDYFEHDPGSFVGLILSRGRVLYKEGRMVG